MRKFKVLRLVNNRLEELAAFDNEADAIDLADRAKYMAPFVYHDDGVSDLASLSVDGVFQHSIKILGASRNH
jgi:hypothetical protein